jgi:hypothetical protein
VSVLRLRRNSNWFLVKCFSMLDALTRSCRTMHRSENLVFFDVNHCLILLSTVASQAVRFYPTVLDAGDRP